VADASPTRADLPTGTVTFLRTDVEASMALTRALGPAWDEANARHLGLIRRAVDAHGGVCVRTEGDAFFGVFPEAGVAVTAAIDAQRALSAQAWPDGVRLRVRMGLHTGEAHLAGDDYGGFEVNRAARIAAAGHGGQILLSEPTRLLADAVLGEGIAVRDLGRQVLRDVPTPERLFQLDILGLQTEFPPLRATHPSAGSLPVRLTSFLGRDGELEELDALLETSRLVTLTGPGGIGKTSLAVELGRAWLDKVPDGVWFVALDAISEPATVRAEIARSLGLFDGPSRPAADGLDHYLADRSVVLVIDNFEHVLDAAGDLGAILRASPATRIVVTSRAPLRLPAEQEYPVRSLEEARARTELFVQRARAVRPGWDPGQDVAVVEEIGAMLDGLPLGLELAAARVSLLPLMAIRDRLAARLPLPGAGPRDVPDRQRTLDAAIRWSHDLLGGAEQRLLHELAVFEGSFDIAQAEQLGGGEVLEGLVTLVEQSLLARDSMVEAAGIRNRMLQTIRSFALDRLAAEGREDEVRRRHAMAYLALAETAAPNLPGGSQARWLDRLSLDHANLRAATRWSIDAGEVELALRFVAASWRFWQLDGHLSEGAEMSDQALALPGADRPTRERLHALAAAGGIAYWRGEAAAAQRLYEEQLALAIQLGDRVREADAQFNLVFARYMGRESLPAAAFEAASEASRLFEALADAVGVARCRWMVATIWMNESHPEEAAPIFEETLAEFERLGDAWYHAMALGSLSWCQYVLGNPTEATRWMVRSLVEYHAMRDIATSTITLPAAAIAANEAGRPFDAAVLLGAFEGLSELYGVRPPLGLEWLIKLGDPFGRTASILSADELADAKARGRRMSLDAAVALVVQIGMTTDAMGTAPAAGAE
jgi:predicted ATPase/class 3 adenylate cyclase